MMYVRYPLSLRQVEDLLCERGIDICHETVRYWWNRFGPLFAAEIRKRRVHHRFYSLWRWHLDEVFVRINGKTHYLWRAVDHEGEVVEVFVTKRRVTADAAYDTVAFYAAAEMRDATVVVPPSKTARVSRRRPRSRARDRTITDVRTLGRRRWKKEAGYQLQARVENAFFRYKSILGDRLRARSRGGRVAESVVACNILNQMTELGRPESYSMGR